jgi:hypothetical protein
MNWPFRLLGHDLTPRVRWLRAALLGALATAAAYRVWLVFAYNPMDALWSDPLRHWTLATQPLNTQPLAAIDPLGYHAYLGLIAQLTAGSRLLVACWTALLSLATPWLWYRFLRELIPGRDWALLGWVVFAALPSWSGIYSYFMQETLMLPLLGAALWATWRSRRKRDTTSFVLATAAWIAAGLTRGICIPLAAVSMTWLWLSQRERARKAAWSALLLLAVLAPLTGRSWYLIRQISPHGLGTMTRLYAMSGARDMTVLFTRGDGRSHWEYRFLSPSMEQAPFAPLSDWRSRRNGHAEFQIDVDAGGRDWVTALNGIEPWTPERAAWLTGDNLILLFFTDSWPDSDRTRAVGSWNYWLRWILAPLGILCVGWTVARRSRQKERLLPALLVTWFIVQGVLPIAVNEGRYRKPFEGLVIAQLLLLASSSRRTSAARAAEVRAGSLESSGSRGT